MAGSYNHIVTRHGNFVSNETFVDMIENLGDAYEMAEETYGMIWWLANNATADIVGPQRDVRTAELVELARVSYKAGLRLAKANKNKRKH